MVREGAVAVWAPSSAGPAPPFPGHPNVVEVLGPGALTLSSGQVEDPHSELMETCNYLRREDPACQCRVVFDPVPGTAARIGRAFPKPRPATSDDLRSLAHLGKPTSLLLIFPPRG